MKHRYLDPDSATDLGSGCWENGKMHGQGVYKYCDGLPMPCYVEELPGQCCISLGRLGYRDIMTVTFSIIFTFGFGERQTSMALTVNHIFSVATGVDLYLWLIARYSIPRPVQRQHPRGLRRLDGASGLLLVRIAGCFCWTIYDNQP